jgi:trans-aconitate methyltransferase
MLELGTGTGVTARAVRAVHPGAHLVGIDESPDMLGERCWRTQSSWYAGSRTRFLTARSTSSSRRSPSHHLDADGKRDLI